MDSDSERSLKIFQNTSKFQNHVPRPGKLLLRELPKPFCAEWELPKTILCRGGTSQNHFVPRGNFPKPVCAEGELPKTILCRGGTSQNHFVPRGNFPKPFCAEGELPKTILCRGGTSQYPVVPRVNFPKPFCAQERSDLFTKTDHKKVVISRGVACA